MRAGFSRMLLLYYIIDSRGCMSTVLSPNIELSFIYFRICSEIFLTPRLEEPRFVIIDL